MHHPPQTATNVAALSYTAVDSSVAALYTHKLYELKTALPAWAQKVIGTNALAVRQHVTHDRQDKPSAHCTTPHPSIHPTLTVHALCSVDWCRVVSAGESNVG